MSKATKLLLNFSGQRLICVAALKHICYCTYIEQSLSERIGTATVKLHIVTQYVLFYVGIVIWKTKHLTFTTKNTYLPKVFTSSNLKKTKTKQKHGNGHLAASIKTGRKMLPGQLGFISFELKEAGPVPWLLAPSLRTLIWKRSELPKRRCIKSCTIPHKRTSLVSSKVLAIGALDGDASMFHKLKEKVLWLFSIRAH